MIHPLGTAELAMFSIAFLDKGLPLGLQVFLATLRPPPMQMLLQESFLSFSGVTCLGGTWLAVGGVCVWPLSDSAPL